MTRRLSTMTAGLAVGITIAVFSACALGAYLYSIRHYQTLLETARGTSLAQAELIRAALEHGMVEEDRTLVNRMIRSFAAEPGVANVMLLDRMGVVRQSSNAPPSAQELNLQSPTCQACHQYPPAERASSRVLETQGGAVLRTVVPFRNRAVCHSCHDPSHKINGIVIFDVDAARIRAAATSDLRWLVGSTAGLALLLVAAIALVVRLAVLKRLQRFETTARQISQGRLDRRVPDAGTDTISWLAREFNTMADSVTGLLGEVRTERERLETVINSIDDGIVVLDAQRNVIAANDAFLARTGGVRERMLGCSCRDAASGMCAVADCPALACLRSGDPQVRVCERRRPDGSVAWEEIHASPIPCSAGTRAQVVEVWRDITDRRAAEARLADSHRLASLGLLASGFSHEMNTPLATVLACVEGIAREARGTSDTSGWSRIGETAAIAREQILRCRGITQHFLRMSSGHTSAGHMVDVHEALTAVARLVRPTASDRGITIETTAAPPLPPRVRCDEADLQHAIMNLTLNAVQASASGGTVALDVEVCDTQVRVHVSDNGCGIPEEHQQRIFEPFFSLRRNGTGLGLFLSLNFVRKWGGDITLVSVPGRGSTFEIVLPAIGAHIEAAIA
jgi:two-component system CheB/CheR fusion protein